MGSDPWVRVSLPRGACASFSLPLSAENVPEELREPFYTDQYDQEHVKPPVVHLLLSAELYCRAGSLILKSDAAKPLLGHDAVIQALAQKGLYVTDQERLVTERDLQRKPIQMVSAAGRAAGSAGRALGVGGAAPVALVRGWPPGSPCRAGVVVSAFGEQELPLGDARSGGTSRRGPRRTVYGDGPVCRCAAGRPGLRSCCGFGFWGAGHP